MTRPAPEQYVVATGVALRYLSRFHDALRLAVAQADREGQSVIRELSADVERPIYADMFRLTRQPRAGTWRDAIPQPLSIE